MAERNMSPNKTPIPEQDPQVRNKNFDEVALGYTEEMAVSEAARCLQCKNRPCVAGCPVNVQIPEFINLIANRDFAGAYKKIKETNSLPAVCGRVCPQETQCEAKCIRGIKGDSVGIGRLERFAADWAMKNLDEKAEMPKRNGHKVAVLGAGPAGLTCAGDLAMLGYDVTIFEAFHKGGGVLVYGIPEFRLPKAIVQAEIDKLGEIGVKLETNILAGKVISIPELFEEEGFDAIFIGTGAGLPMFMHIPGENYNGVFSANEYLTRTNLMKAYSEEAATPMIRFKKVAVVGGGNVAMDSARCAQRLGADTVYIVYRRSMEEMPARQEEVHHAIEEGIVFNILTNPTQIIGDDKGYVKGIECIKMELGEPDASGRRRPIPIEGSEFVLDVDAVIMALGTNPNPIISDNTPDLEVNKKGCILADEETGATSIPGVFAGGDIVTGAATVILAMGAGKVAATAIDKYIQEKK
ncbi:MAG: NADPH-dependent glutamate synthase [Eubacteriaceae bacterium]|jgi:glutamate synthase (NADPH/NADH) small chain|nr:NADPH-dependent glutamate synthase [Eubacteriaceae bacterium]